MSAVVDVLLGVSLVANVILLALVVYAVQGWAGTIKDWIGTLDEWDASDAELVELLDQADSPTTVEGAP